MTFSNCVKEAQGNGHGETNPVRVAVLGTRAIGLGVAAFLSHGGHVPIIWSPSGRTGPLTSVTATGVIEGQFAVRYASSAAEAVAGADVIIITVPGYGHRAVIDSCIPHLVDGQVVIICSHMSLSAFYLMKKCRSKVTVVAWNTTILQP